MRKLLGIILLSVLTCEYSLSQNTIAISESIRPSCANEFVFYQSEPIASPAPCDTYYNWTVTGGTIYDSETQSSQGTAYSKFDATGVYVKWSSTATNRRISLSTTFAEIMEPSGGIGLCTDTNGQITYSGSVTPNVTGIVNTAPPSVPTDSYSAQFEGTNVGSNLCTEQLIDFSWDLPTPAQNNFRIENRIIAEVGGNVRVLSNWSVSRTSVSRRLNYSNSAVQVVVKAESRYRDCPDRTASVTLGTYTVYPQPSIGGYTVEAPTCASGEDGQIVLNNVDPVFTDYVVSLYQGSTRLETYNITSVIENGSNSITLSNNTTAQKYDEYGNPISGENKLKLTPGLWTFALEANSWPSGSGTPDNVCYLEYTVTIPERPCISQGSTIHIDNDTNQASTTLTITGGSTPFSYTTGIAASNYTVEDDPNDSNKKIVSISGLSDPGDYSFSVTDNNDYTEDIDFPIYNNKFTAGIVLKSSAARGGQTECDGENGTLRATITPANSVNFNTLLYGARSTTYRWNDDNTTPTISRDLSGASAGTDYRVTIDLGDGNTSTSASGLSTSILYEQLSPSVAESSNLFLQCDGETGSIDLTISGGDGTNTVSWTGPSGFTNTGASISNLASGDYNYVVTDTRNGLSCTASGTVTIEDDVPDIAKVTDSESAATCATDLSSVDISITKGTGDDYTGGYDVIISGSPPSPTYTYAGSSTPITVSKDPGTSFTVTLTKKEDDTDCQIVSQRFTVPGYSNTFSVGFDASSATDVINPSCYDDGGSINFSLTGGNASGYSYEILEKASGCTEDGCSVYNDADFIAVYDEVDAADFDSSDINVTNINPNGTYLLQVSDGSCTYYHEFSFASAPDQPTFTVDTTTAYQLTCYGDVRDIPVGLNEAKGVVSNFSFNLERKLTAGGIYSDYPAFDPTNITSTSLTINDLPVGFYRLSGEDGNFCVFDTVEFELAQPSAPFEIVSTVKNEQYSYLDTAYHVKNYREANGSISVEAQGGKTKYTFELYRNGNKLDSITRTVAVNEVRTFTGLYASDGSGGIYNYTVKAIDSLTCDTTSTALTLREPELLELNFWLNKYSNSATDTFNIKCNGGTDTVFVRAQGGIPKYRVVLKTATGSTIDADTIDNDGGMLYFAGVGAGDYKLSLTDKVADTANSFSKTIESAQFQLIEPSAITDTTKMVEPTCFGGNDGSYTVKPSGGVPYALGEYLIKFYDADTVELQSELVSSSTLVSDSGKYFYTVRDTLSGCDTIFHAFNIVEWPRLMIDNLITEYPLCFGDSTAKLNVYVKDGRPLNDTYGVVLYDSTNSRVDSLVTDTNGYTLFEDLFSGEYYVTVYDSALCSYKDTIYVEERKDPLEISQTEKQASTCANSDNAKLKVYSAGGDVMHYYSIDNGASWRTPEPGNIYVGADNKVDSAFVVFDSLESGGIYEIWLKDSNYYDESFDGSCLISKTDTISTTPELVLDWEKENVSCYNAADGSITLIPSFGIEKALSYFDISITKNGTAFAENTLTLTGLSYGLYEVELSLSAADACPTVLNEEIFIERPDSPLTAQVQSTSDYNCANPEEIVVRGNVEGGWPKNGYEYKFNNGTYEPFVPNLSAFRFTESLTIGEHVLTIRDSKGCEESTIFTVEPLNFSVEVLNQTDVSCYGGNDGLLQLTSANGNLAYKLWNATDSFKIAAIDTALFDAIPAGTYQLIASSGACLSDTLSFTFTSPDEIIIDYTILNQPTCGEANGEVVTNISGGVAPYTTNWLYKGGQLLAADALMAGDYIVIVEDAMGCQKRDSVYLEEQTDLSATVVDISQATCGAANASVTLNITGGVPGYSIEWYNSQNALVGNGSLLSDISKGTYYYQLSDQSGCAITDTVYVGGDEALSVSTANTTQATCGIANGSVSLSVTGGNAPYTVNWPSTIPFTNGLSASGLKGGIVYEVLVTDSTNCEQTFKFSINNTSGPELGISQFNPSCELANGAIEITSLSGKEPLSITWNGVADTSRLKTGLGEGTYSITVTDADSCSTTKVVELEEDLSNQLTVSNSITPSSCGGSNGVIELNISGGFTPYQISWDDNASITEGRRTNLTAGTYEVTITDSVGCQIEKSIVLNEVASPLLTVESFVQASCGSANGSIVLSQLSNDYVYHWSHDDGITTNSAEGLSAGRYDIYAENGSCTTDTISFYITSPGTDLNISVVETIAATCESTYDGAAEINISGGASPYTISWNDEQNQNVERASNLLPGTYTVLVTDASGCSAVKSVTVGTVNPVYIASFNKETPSCHTATDGSIEVVVAGGTGNYSYLWSTGANSKTLTDVAAGTYSVEVFDNDECAVSESVTLIAPDSLSLQASVAAPRCYESANGSAELSINGGTAPYSVSWPDGNTSLRRYDLLTGDYTVEVTDDNGCLLTQVVTVPQKDSVTINYTIEHASCYNANDAGIELTSIGNARSPLVKWSNGQRGPVLRNVTAGNYTATITDANGCATAFEFTITEPDLLELVEVEAAATKCNDASNGSITYEVKGGTAPYTYRWSDGAISKNRSGLRAGTYEVLVTDNAGCAIAESFEIEEPDPLLIRAELTGVSCFGSADGQATIEVNGGTAPYQISWSDGETTFTREDLTAGRYDVTITDANNCSLTQRLTIDNINPIEIESISRDIPSCYQGSDGSISIEVAGGSGDYTISWENGAQGATIDNIAAGTYAVTITDGNGCTFNGSIRLDDAAPINISQLIVADPICYDEPSGMVAVTPSGGSAPYKVIWEDGVEASERNDLLAGTHNFTIQDAEGCTTAYEVTLENPPLEELSNLPEIVYLCTGGYITLDAGNWDSYSWTSDNTFSSTEREVRIDAEGNYHIEVTNEAGCIDAHDIEVIKDDDLLQADFLLTSEAVVGDTVLIIDISWPMPGSVEWFNPDDKDFYLVSQEADYQEVIFTRTGEFEMSMKANLDQCEAYVTKTINVISQDEAARLKEEELSKSQGKLHLSTNIYPNPNYGTFRLEVEGNQQHDIDVRIVDLHKGYEYYQLSGKQQQKHVFNITDDRLPAGVYIAVIETNGQTISKRFVVK